MDVRAGSYPPTGARVSSGPRGILLPGEEYVESYAFPLLDVSFPVPGLYGFQLSADGAHPAELLAAEGLLARDFT